MCGRGAPWTDGAGTTNPRSVSAVAAPVAAGEEAQVRATGAWLAIIAITVSQACLDELHILYRGEIWKRATDWIETHGLVSSREVASSLSVLAFLEPLTGAQVHHLLLKCTICTLIRAQRSLKSGHVVQVAKTLLDARLALMRKRLSTLQADDGLDHAARTVGCLILCTEHEQGRCAADVHLTVRCCLCRRWHWTWLGSCLHPWHRAANCSCPFLAFQQLLCYPRLLGARDWAAQNCCLTHQRSVRLLQTSSRRGR